MPDNRTTRDIRALLNVATEVRLREWAENWLVHVAVTPDGPDIINEEMHRAFEEIE